MALLKPISIVSIFYLNILMLCIQSNPASPDLPLPKQKNSTLLKQILNVKDGNNVPDYEIVQLRILSKRSVDDQDVMRVNLYAFGEHLQLRLRRNNDFNEASKKTKLYKAKLADSGGFQLTEVICEDDDVIQYVDPVHMAAVSVSHGPDGKLQLDGVIGDDLLIKPAPMDAEFLPDYFTYEWDFSDENGGISAAKSGVHVVYRSLMESRLFSRVALDDVLPTINSTSKGRRRKRPLKVWPEVLLMVDYDSYAMHLSRGLNDAQIRRYYISFLNGVDLRFKILSDPQISLVLSQIILFKSREDTPYLKSGPYLEGNMFEGQEAIRQLAHHLYSVKTQKQGAYIEFDIAILLTNMDMCTNRFFGCNQGTIGLAFYMGACLEQPEEGRWMGAAIVEDNGGFDGVLTAAHEIGHLLGSTHDGVSHPNISYRSSPFCYNSEGYLMSSQLASKRIFQWSDCSIQQFRYFLSLERASCLFNQPSYRNELEGSELPGVLVSLDEQCDRIWGTRASARDSRVCASLHCHRPPNGTFERLNAPYQLPPAAEGSFCGKHMHCRHGKCVSKSLTYSQAWNLKPAHDNWEYHDPPTTTTTKTPPPMDEACSEETEEFFCEVYFSTLSSLEACKNSRIREECCYSYKIFCNE